MCCLGIQSTCFQFLYNCIIQLCRAECCRGRPHPSFLNRNKERAGGSTISHLLQMLLASISNFPSDITFFSATFLVDLWVGTCSLKMLLCLHRVAIECPSHHQLPLRDLCREGPLSFWVISWDPCNKRQINRRKTNRSLFTYLSHVYMGDIQGNMSHFLGWNSILKRKGEGWWFPRMMNRRALGNLLEGATVCDRVPLGVALTSGLLSCGESVFPGWCNSWGGDWWELSSLWRICL